MARLFEQVRRSPDSHYPSFLTTLEKVDSVFRLEEGLPRWMISFQDNERVTIGRHASCEILFPDDKTYISRNHCTLYVMDGKLFLTDHSRNGTFFIHDSHDEKLLVNETVEIHGGEYIILGHKNGTLLRIMKMKKETEQFAVQIVEAVFMTDVILQDDRW